MVGRSSPRALRFRRGAHAVVASVAAATLVTFGYWGVIFYAAALFALHVKPRSTRSEDLNAMNAMMEGADERSAAGWRAFGARAGRKTLTLPLPLPPWWIVFAGYVPALALVPLVGIQGIDGTADLARRLALGAFAIASIWACSFGVPRRFRTARQLVFGSDGLRLHDGAFLPWSEVERVVSRKDGSAVEVHLREGAPAVVPTWSLEVADHLARVLREAVRAGRAHEAEEAAPVGGFRDGAAPMRWVHALRTASSAAERDAVLVRVPPPAAERLADETADAELEAALRAHLGS